MPRSHIRAGWLPILLISLLIAGCVTVGPDYKQDQPPLPANWSEPLPAHAVDTSILENWWGGFHDPDLDRLIRRAIAGNSDLKIARQRLIAARAARIVAGAAALPQVDAIAEPVTARSSETLAWPPGIGDYQSLELGFDASWEIDLFGGLRRSREAAAAEADATRADRQAILTSLLSEVCADYARLRATQARLAIAQNDVATANAIVSLHRIGLRRGLGTTTTLDDALSRLDAAQAKQPPLQDQIGRLTHALAVLAGQNPENDLQLDVAAPLQAPVSLPTLVPLDVIANRPDIRRADRRYAAALARIGVARADALPHFSIPLLLTPQTSDPERLFSLASLTWEIAGELTQNVYDGGKSDARMVEARAEAEAARLAYEETIRQALREIEDARLALRSDTDQTTALAQSAEQARQVLENQKRLHDAGLISLVDVLSARRESLAADDRMAQSQLAVVIDVVALYKAFGGGWQSIDLDAATPSTP